MESQATTTMELPFDINSLTWLWNTISSFRILCHNLLKYFKLAKIGNVFVLDNLEDEKQVESTSIYDYEDILTKILHIGKVFI